MSRSRRPSIVLGASVLVLVALGTVLWLHARSVEGHLRLVAQDAAAVLGSLESGDPVLVEADLAALSSSTSAAAAGAGDWRWSVLTRLPVVGDDARGVRTAARVLEDLCDQGLVQLPRIMVGLDRLAPDGGRVDVDAAVGLQPAVTRLRDSIADASRRLDAEDPAGFVGVLRSRFEALELDIAKAASAAEAASIVVDLLPPLLGQSSPRNYLLVFQNNAEIRATGGLPGVASVLTADRGRVDMKRVVSVADLAKRESPVLTLSAAERQIFTTRVGTFVQDANFTPDWPRAADLIRTRWEEEYPGRIDGVLTVDTVGMSYLLAATGPVEVSGYVITADNAVDVLLHQVYVDLADTAQQDALFQEVATIVFDRISSGHVVDFPTLVRALVSATREGRLLLNLTDDREQRRLADTRVAGATHDPTGVAAAVDVTFLDGTGSKMSYYLDYEVDAFAVDCADGRAQVSVQARVASQAPSDAGALPVSVTGGGAFGVRPGNQLVHARLFAPTDGRVTGLVIEDEAYEVKPTLLAGRMVSTAYLLLTPGESETVTWTLDVPARDEQPVRVTPGIEAGDASSVVPMAC